MTFDSRTAWVTALDELERTLDATARLLSGETPTEALDMPEWSPPHIKGSLPADLVARAERLLGRQQAYIDEIASARLVTRQKMVLLDKLTGGYGPASTAVPVYVDITA